MARMGHESERAALIYQHEARGADATIANAIDAHVDAERSRDSDHDDSPAGAQALQANGTLTAGGAAKPRKRSRPRLEAPSSTWAFRWERVTGIEPALSAWELDRS
jgi:hypothetical protein